MTTTIQAIQFNDKITLRRQAQKDDLVDIARALGLAATPSLRLDFLREMLTNELTRIAKSEGRGEPSWKGVNGKQVTKGELLAYAHALGSAMPATTIIPVDRLRGIIRTMLTRRAERIEADRKWNETEDAAAAEFNAREAEFADLPAAEVAVLTIKLTHQEVNVLIEALETRSVLPSVRALRAKLVALLPTAG